MCGNCAAIGRRRAGSSGATGTDLNGALIGPLGHADSHVTRQQQRAPNTRTNNRKRATPNAVLPPSTFYGSLTRHYRFCFVLFCFYVGKDDKKLKRSEKERPSPSFHQVSSNLVSMGFGNESNLILLFGFRFMVVFLSEFQRANRELFFLTDWLVVGSFPFKIGFDGSTGIRRPENEFSQKDYEGFLPSCLLELFLFCVASNGFFSGRRVAFWRPQVNFLSRAGKRGVSGRVFRANSYFRCH